MIQHKGEGRICPDELVREERDCLIGCSAEASKPSEPTADGKGGEGGGGEAEPIAGMEEEVERTYCSIEEELWTPCSADCLQERYMGEECDKEAEVGVMTR